MLRLIVSLLTLPPVPASYVGATLAGQPELGHELERISWREARARWVSIHVRDAWASERVHKRALARNILSQSCPWHGSEHGGWSTRGPHGLMAGYSLRYLWPCAPAWIIDVPLFSAIAAARRAQAQCERFGACDRAGRLSFWNGSWNDEWTKPNPKEEDQADA